MNVYGLPDLDAAPEDAEGDGTAAGDRGGDVEALRAAAGGDGDGTAQPDPDHGGDAVHDDTEDPVPAAATNEDAEDAVPVAADDHGGEVVALAGGWVRGARVILSVAGTTARQLFLNYAESPDFRVLRAFAPGSRETARALAGAAALLENVARPGDPVQGGGIVPYFCNSLKRWWRRLRVRTLGGVTTLERKLSYNCTICMDTMDTGDVVRTLSCNHVFHCRNSDKCRDGHIDRWLRDEPTMSYPICRKTARLVLPWKAPPPAPAPESANQESSSSSSGLEDTALPRSSPQ